VEVAVLGPVAVRVDGVEVGLGTPRQRALVTALALSAGRPVSVDTLVELLWGDAPPPGVATTLQTYVSGLRRVLEPERQRRAPATVLVTVAPGYALRVRDVDALRFESAVGAVHQLLGPHGGMGVGGTGVTGTTAAPLGHEELESAVAALDEALAWWRGTPYGELGDAPDAVAARARLEELRLVASEDRARAELALGRHATVAAELDALTAAHPLRERLWALRALALTRSGRQADALEVLRRAASCATCRPRSCARTRGSPGCRPPPARERCRRSGHPGRPASRGRPSHSRPRPRRGISPTRRPSRQWRRGGWSAATRSSLRSGRRWPVPQVGRRRSRC
jgi:DNA-binding SARP family transcriptional activator